MDETRQRIVEAAVKLHTTVGPAHTSVVAVAEAAGVQRHTVYSHFPDERSLFTACSGLFYERNPYPPMEPWREIPEPAARLDRALGDMYRYFRAHDRELWPIVRDAPLLPHFTGRRLAEGRSRVAAAITEGWPARGATARRMRALLDVALRFETWRALTADGGLTDRDAAATMADAVLCADRKA